MAWMFSVCFLAIVYKGPANHLSISVCVFSLQPQNILLTSARPLGDIRIVDFGLSRRMDSLTEVREILGTPEYVGESLTALKCWWEGCMGPVFEQCGWTVILSIGFLPHSL